MSTDESNAEVSLLQHLDLRQINCLNEAEHHTLKGIVESKNQNATGAYLLSDADEQLLLNIPFNQSVKVRAISIRSSSPEQAPKSIKILINRPALGFEDVEDADEPTVAQSLELSPEDVQEGKVLALRYVRFQAVNSLHIFVASNQGGGDETRIDAVDIFGTTVETTKSLSGLSKQEE
ncbi:hypothetical protein HGRIS_013362 [Hohenbuehelia grisea]|uniref:PITH domain-containing protein n=1 Tax=Hohenbuehelia grisea TaxID=104357 RepID=A0ABR3IVA1_9AGAR